MATNVSTWLRAFRPPLQHAYPRPEEEIDLELAALLRRADERHADSAPETDLDIDPEIEDSENPQD